MGKMGPGWMVKTGKTRRQTPKTDCVLIFKPRKLQGRAQKRKIYNKRKAETQLKNVLSKRKNYLKGLLIHKKGPNWHKGNKQLIEREKLELSQLKREFKKNRQIAQDD